MRYLIALAIAAALATAGTAAAGGWATVQLASLPTGIDSGETWAAQFTVLRHGVTPTDGAAPSLTIRSSESGETAAFAAEPTGETGVYVARVVFPEPGEWAFEIDNGLVATGYGESATTTYAPVTVGTGSGGEPGSFPVLPALGIGGALVLAGAAAFALLRQRRLTPAS